MAEPMPVRVLLVTGMSGAGRSTCLNVLEDIGFEALDNLPLPLATNLLNPRASIDNDLAIGMDSRTRGFDPERLLAQMAIWRQSTSHSFSLIFMDCDDGILLRRYTETRRRHPMADDRSVADGIAKERELMKPLLDAADVRIDTSQLSVADLRALVNGHFDKHAEQRLQITVMSFSFKRGLPREADLVFDMRFLRNPHYNEALRPLTGRDPAVRDYVRADPDYDTTIQRLFDLILPLLPRYLSEGKSYLTIAIGCTGGRHRSVAVAEHLGALLDAQGWSIRVRHRDTDVPEMADLQAQVQGTPV